jgi:Protein of unknown function (DUF2971)
MGTVYKFCDNRGVAILQNLELKITPANQFNDPFEFTPVVVCSDLEAEARSLIEPQDMRFFESKYFEEKASGKFVGSFQGFMDEFVTSHLMKAIPDTAKKLQDGYLDLISTHFGVLCLSKKRNSIVMFAHYGDNHHGFVIGFDDSNSVFQKGKGLLPVNYVSERIVFDMNWEMGGAEERKYAEMLIFTKNEEWKYENEVRQIFPLDECPIKKPFKDKRTEKEMTNHFYPMPAEAIQSVSLGIKCSTELESQIRLVLQNKHFSHVKLERARLHDSKFELTFE